MDNEQFNVSIEQSKLLGSALRVKIISQLVDQPRTSKQVADLLGHSAGNVHYHIKKLFEGGLLELVEVKQIGGVMEKYYRAKARWFNSTSTEVIDPVLEDNFISSDSTALIIRLNLTSTQQEEITNEFKVFLEKWVEKTGVNDEMDNAQEFSIGVKINSTKPKEVDGKND